MPRLSGRGQTGSHPPTPQGGCGSALRGSLKPAPRLHPWRGLDRDHPRPGLSCRRDDPGPLGAGLASWAVITDAQLHLLSQSCARFDQRRPGTRHCAEGPNHEAQVGAGDGPFPRAEAAWSWGLQSRRIFMAVPPLQQAILQMEKLRLGKLKSFSLRYAERRGDNEDSGASLPTRYSTGAWLADKPGAPGVTGGGRPARGPL